MGLHTRDWTGIKVYSPQCVDFHTERIHFPPQTVPRHFYFSLFLRAMAKILGVIFFFTDSFLLALGLLEKTSSSTIKKQLAIFDIQKPGIFLNSCGLFSLGCYLYMCLFIFIWLPYCLFPRAYDEHVKSVSNSTFQSTMSGVLRAGSSSFTVHPYNSASQSCIIY